MSHVSQDRLDRSPTGDQLPLDRMTNNRLTVEHKIDQQLEPDVFSHLPPSLRQIREWAEELANFGWPHFGEFAQRVESARAEFLEFALERVWNSRDTSRELSAERNMRFRPDVADLLEEYDRLIHQLREAELHFESWQAACRRFEDVCQCGREQSAENLQTPHAPS